MIAQIRTIRDKEDMKKNNNKGKEKEDKKEEEIRKEGKKERWKGGAIQMKRAYTEL